MPKRPPRAPRELPVPPDLGTSPRPMRRALATPLGTLWFGRRRGPARVAAGSQRGSGGRRSALRDRQGGVGRVRLARRLRRLVRRLARRGRARAHAAGSAYVCGFSEILAEVKARSARRFAAAAAGWSGTTATRPTSAATGAARTSRSCTCASRTPAHRRRRRARAVQRPHHALPGAGAGGVIAVRPRRAPRPLAAQPARRQAARRARDPGPLQRHGREDRHPTQKPEAT